MFKSFSQAGVHEEGSSHNDSQRTNPLPPIHYPSTLFENNELATDDAAISNHKNKPSNGFNDTSVSSDTINRNVTNVTNVANVTNSTNARPSGTQAVKGNQANPERANQQLRAKRVVEAVEKVHDHQSPTPLTDRYLEYRKNLRHPNRPPFDPAKLWQLKHGILPIMTELINVVDVATLNSLPIEAVAILDRINQKLKRYREWTDELNGEQAEWVCERQYVIDKLIVESIPEALSHYEQLLRFSPHRTKNNTVHGNMTAGDMITDLFLEIDYELDELLDELHLIVLNRLATTHRYVKSRTQN